MRQETSILVASIYRAGKRTLRKVGGKPPPENMQVDSTGYASLGAKINGGGGEKAESNLESPRRGV